MLLDRTGQPVQPQRRRRHVDGSLVNVYSGIERAAFDDPARVSADAGADLEHALALPVYLRQRVRQNVALMRVTIALDLLEIGLRPFGGLAPVRIAWPAVPETLH